VRIVLDTNVIVSALMVKGSIPDQLLSLWDGKTYDLVTSATQIDELSRVLDYDKIKKRIEVGEAKALMARLHATAFLACDLPTVSYSVDPTDNLILATAIAGKASLLVSGDKKHLVNLGAIEGIPIVLPSEALQRIVRSK